MSQITDIAVNFAGMDGDGNCVSVRDVDGSQVLWDGWGRKTCFEGMDGDGYSLCGRGWGIGDVLIFHYGTALYMRFHHLFTCLH